MTPWDPQSRLSLFGSQSFWGACFQESTQHRELHVACKHPSLSCRVSSPRAPSVACPSLSKYLSGEVWGSPFGFP